MMKKIAVLTLALSLSMVGCGEKRPETWMEGVTFVNLAPKEEVSRSEEIILTEDKTDLSFSVDYAHSGLKLKLGLRAADGTEYVQEVVGGHASGTFENLPAGTYVMFVQNMEEDEIYSSWQDNPEVYNVTGVLNFTL
ncbi:MAG: hypothetical protein HFH82_11245 [Lachnospiraceae bacterium]|nr:hypothetical protein [Lachnospiraceae bacterium]